MSAIDLSKMQQNVLSVIRENPWAANDEAALLDLYWHKFCDWDDTKSLYWNLSRSTRPESITRRRRELFNLGLIEYSEEAEKRREEAMINEKERAAPKAVSWMYD